jgi:hypothetical protein
MTNWKSIGTLAAIVAVAATYGGPAQAEGDGYPSAGLLLGYGVTTSKNDTVQEREPAGFGLGLRGGYTLPMNVYLGATFVYHFGFSESTPEGDVSGNILYFGVEGGYDIEAGPVLVRPYLGLGDVIGSVTIPTVSSPFLNIAGGTTSEGHFGLWPGGTVLYPIDNFFVGGDLRYLIVTGSDAHFNAFGIFATGGMKF